MTVEYNADLYKYNTMRLHSIAKIIYRPILGIYERISFL
jgi:hypothetical protein